MTPSLRALSLAALALPLAGPEAIGAGSFSLIGESLFLQDGRTPERLIRTSAPATGAGAPSLFRGRAEGTLFAPRERVEAAAAAAGAAAPAIPATGPRAARLKHLIASAEAGRAGYDAVQHGARVKPPKPPTAMTLGEIYRWIADTPGQPHAIGRYQMIPATLKRLVRTLGVGLDERFSGDLQDRLADLLLDEAGYADFTTGRMNRRAFMNNLAKIWAGLPNSSGRSHYHGHAGNRATMSWTRFDEEMARIFQG